MTNLLAQHWMSLEKAAAKVRRDKTSLRGPIMRGEIHARDNNGKKTNKVVLGKTHVLFSDVVRWSNSARRVNRKRQAVQYSKVPTPPSEAVMVVEKNGTRLTITLPTSEAKTFVESFFN